MTLMIRGAMMAVALTVGAVAGAAPRNPMVGGAAMYPTKTIVENASQSKDHTTLVAAVKAAGLVDTLSGPAPVHGTVAIPDQDEPKVDESCDSRFNPPQASLARNWIRKTWKS